MILVIIVKQRKTARPERKMRVFRAKFILTLKNYLPPVCPLPDAFDRMKRL